MLMLMSTVDINKLFNSLLLTSTSSNFFVLYAYGSGAAKACEASDRDMAAQLVWVPHSAHAWMLASVVGQADGVGNDAKYTVAEYAAQTLPLGAPEKTTIKAKNTRMVDLSQLETNVRDIASVQSMTEAPLLDILRRRHLVGKIYTMVSDILIATNPYMVVPGIYDNMDPYNYILGETEPHIYTTANLAYTKMCDPSAPKGEQDQACLVSGESGAGKTEGCKSIMKFLAHLSAMGGAGASEVEAHKGPTNVEDKVMLCNPFLEAFGNAQTIMNDNSSRFGKFLKILYNQKKRIAGATMEHYLLEKARLVNQGPSECNYHVFYQMIAGVDDATRARLQLKPVTEYTMLNYGGITEQRPQDDKGEFEEATEAMAAIGIERDSEQTHIFSVLAGLLELGNVTWAAPGAADKGTSMAAMKAVPTPETRESLALAAEHLGLDPGFTGFQSLFKAITVVTFSAGGRGTMTTIMQRPVQCSDRSMAMIKHTYGHLFDWLVRRVNNLLEPHGDVVIERFIGILDIFGFEIFEKNSFEQLCINFANEKLQRLFNDHIFKLEQKEYAAEQLPVDKITFDDNSACVALIEGYDGKALSNFQSFFNLLEEQTLRTEATGNSDDSTAKVTDADLATALKGYFGVKPSLNKSKVDSATRRKTYAIKDKKAFAKAIGDNIKSKNKNATSKLVTAFKNSAKYIKLDSGVATPDAPGGFMIKHFAGCVSYHFEGFLTKNKDKLSDGLVNLLKMSNNPFVQRLFDEKLQAAADAAAAAEAGRGSGDASPDAPSTPVKKSRKSRKGGGRKPKGTKMISSNFTNQLSSLTAKLNHCKSHYVRCVKPNGKKLKYNQGLGAFEGDMSLRQLQYAGVMETVRIRQAGYPVRETFDQFWARCVACKYNETVGLPESPGDVRLACMTVLCACFDPSFNPASYDHSTKAGTPASGKWLLGATKVFGKESLMRKLQEWQMEIVLPQLQRYARVRNVRIAFRAYHTAKWAKRNAHLAGDARIVQALARAAQHATTTAQNIVQYRRREERKNRSANLAKARGMTLEQAAALTSDDIARMHPLALCAIDLPSLKVFSPATSAAWASAMTEESARAKRLSPEQAAQLTDDQLHAFSPIAVAYARNNFGKLDAEQLGDLVERVDEAGGYFAASAKGFALNDWSELDAAILHHYMRIPAARASYFRSTAAGMRQVTGSAAAKMSAEQVASFPSMALTSLPVRSAARLMPEAARAWVGVVKRAAERFAQLTPDVGKKLGANDIELVSPTALLGMKPETVVALSSRAKAARGAVIEEAMAQVQAEVGGLNSSTWGAIGLDAEIARCIPGVDEAMSTAARAEEAKRQAAAAAEAARLKVLAEAEARRLERERMNLIRHCEALARAAIVKKVLQQRATDQAVGNAAEFFDTLVTRRVARAWMQEMSSACCATEDYAGASVRRIQALIVREEARWARIRDLLIEDMVDLRDVTTGRSCVHAAAKSGCAAHLAAVLAAGSFRGISASRLLVVRDLAFNTPLHLAAAAGNDGVEVARFILTTCADQEEADWVRGAVNEPNKDSALDIALACEEPAGDMIALLMKFGLRAKPSSAEQPTTGTAAALRVLKRSEIAAAARKDDVHQRFLALDPMSDRFVVERAQKAKEAAATKLQAVIRGIDTRLEMVATSELGGATPYAKGLRAENDALGLELSVAAQSVVETCREFAFVAREYDGLLLNADLSAREAPVWPPAEWASSEPSAVTGRMRSVEEELRAAASAIVRLASQMRRASQSSFSGKGVDDRLIDAMSSHVDKLERRAEEITRVRAAVERGIAEPKELEFIVEGAASMLDAAQRIQLLVEMAAAQVDAVPPPRRAGDSTTPVRLEAELRDAAHSVRQLHKRMENAGQSNDNLYRQAQMLDMRATELGALREAVARGTAPVEDLQLVEDKAAAVVDAAAKIKAVAALADDQLAAPVAQSRRAHLVRSMTASQTFAPVTVTPQHGSGWREVEGPVEGGQLVRYFYHDETRETVWQLPPGTPFISAANPPAAAPAMSPSRVVESWEEAQIELMRSPDPEQKNANVMAPADTLRVQSLHARLLRANLALQRLASPAGWSGWSYIDKKGVLQGP